MFPLLYFPFVVITFLNIQICTSRLGPNTYIEYGNIFFYHGSATTTGVESITKVGSRYQGGC
jgi:hypothetical protein